MSSVIAVYKPQGLTPLQTIQLLKNKYPQYDQSTLGYAGRLDPLAEGVMLLLKDEENKKRKEYERLPKTYIFKMLCGVATDTYDYMGLITQIHQPPQMRKLEQTLRPLLATFIGKQKQPYPPYSSARVDGKPLYYWARKHIQKQAPVKLIEIYSASIVGIEAIAMKDAAEHAVNIIADVIGDFRQEEIIQKWREAASAYTFPLVTCKIECSSGTYVRSLAHTIGLQMGSGAIAYHIIRTQVGGFTLQDALHVGNERKSSKLPK